MAQLSSCHSWDSQDSKKPCFLIYSIYWYKDSSLRGNVTSGLRWLWCGILSGRGNRGRVSCKSSFVFLLGLFHKCANHTQPALKFQWRETHMHSDTQPCTRPDEEARCRGRWKLHRCISHTTALWIIELSWLSWSMLLRAHWDPLTRQTLHYTHIHVGFFFFSACSCSSSRWDSPWCASVHFLLFWTSTCLSSSQIRWRISQARSHY